MQIARRVSPALPQRDDVVHMLSRLGAAMLQAVHAKGVGRQVASPDPPPASVITARGRRAPRVGLGLIKARGPQTMLGQARRHYQPTLYPVFVVLLVRILRTVTACQTPALKVSVTASPSSLWFAGQ